MSNRQVVFLLFHFQFLDIIFSQGDKILIKFFSSTFYDHFEAVLIHLNLKFDAFYNALQKILCFLRYIESDRMFFRFPTLKFKY